VPTELVPEVEADVDIVGCGLVRVLACFVGLLDVGLIAPDGFHPSNSGSSTTSEPRRLIRLTTSSRAGAGAR
jgi:hypothetical protein